MLCAKERCVPVCLSGLFTIFLSDKLLRRAHIIVWIIEFEVLITARTHVLYIAIFPPPPPTSRFHHYDCLVVPRHSIADNFPWEKVSLLVEYEPLRTLLFPEGSFPEAARLKQYVTLRTVRDPSASNLADSGMV